MAEVETAFWETRGVRKNCQLCSGNVSYTFHNPPLFNPNGQKRNPALLLLEHVIPNTTVRRSVSLTLSDLFILFLLLFLPGCV